MYVGRHVTWSCCPVMDGRWSADLGGDKFMRGALGEGYSCAGGSVNVELQLSCQLFVLQLALQPVWWNQRQLLCDTARQSNQIHQGESQNGRQSHSSTHNPLLCVGKDSATERRRRSPLRPIKYSSDKRHPAHGSIPTGSSSTPPRDVLQ